ncbi:hypothetical protein EDB83DRAFT_1833913 [Lactarius deliciosus]|nr:hypothetical protein EDB83DRAFT_1833913 [Lactarius deliciosus]
MKPCVSKFVHRASLFRLDSPIRNTYNALIVNSDHLKVSIVAVKIYHAKDLPEWRNMTRTAYDMDPLVEVSIGEQVKRTSVKQHTRIPVWYEQRSLHMRQHDLSLLYDSSFRPG